MKTRDSKRLALTLVELIVVLVVLAGLASIVVPLISYSGADAQLTVTEATLVAVRDSIFRYRGEMSDLPRPGPGEVSAAPFRLDKPQLRYLFMPPLDSRRFDPVLKVGWNGPYVSGVHSTYRFGPNTGRPMTSYDPEYLASFTPFASKLAAQQGISVQNVLKAFGEPISTSTNTGDPAVFDGWGYPIIIRPNLAGTSWLLQSAGPDNTLEPDPETIGDDKFLLLAPITS